MLLDKPSSSTIVSGLYYYEDNSLVAFPECIIGTDITLTNVHDPLFELTALNPNNQIQVIINMTNSDNKKKISIFIKINPSNSNGSIKYRINIPTQSFKTTSNAKIFVKICSNNKLISNKVKLVKYSISGYSF